MNSRQNHFARQSSLKLIMKDNQPIVTNCPPTQVELQPETNTKPTAKNSAIAIFLLLALFDTLAALISLLTYQTIEMTGMFVITGLLFVIIALAIARSK